MEKFYLGLDIGTDSVGLACTDEKYNLLRAKGKDLWAVRLFDEAASAAQRRVYRTARRRLQRRRWRIGILQDLFAPFIDDELFFRRLNNSGFVFEDKDELLQSPYSLFADKDFTDKQFYKKYKTIYHLRHDLIYGSDKVDLRLYYLAIHHIIKYRGHFLFDGEIGEVRNIKNQFDKLNMIAERLFDDNAPYFDSSKADAFKQIALSGKGKNDKKNDSLVLFDCKASQQCKAILTMLLGGKEKLCNIFATDAYADEKSFSFGDITDDEFDAKQEVLGNDFEYLQAMRDIFGFFLFEKTLSGNRYISDAMIGLYDKHKRDLRKLKDLVIKCCPHGDYVKLFKSVSEKSNYVNYIGYTKTAKKKVNVDKCKPDEFFLYLKKFLTERKALFDGKGEAYSAACAEILDELGDGKSFLPKILNADNGLFPRQINQDELRKILDALCRDYPQFGVKAGDDMSIADKIEKLFEFKIPYYVGPLNTYHSSAGGNSWAKRVRDGKILPWNIEQKIDFAASNELFMRRMTGKCSYLYLEDVLPRCSIFYQAFDVLNQLNKLRIAERPISVELKQGIFIELFLKRRRVTDKMILNYLVSLGQISPSEVGAVKLSGKDGDFKASMSSYITLCAVLGEAFVKEHIDICEDIILWHTLNTDKRIVEKLILSHYGELPEISAKIKELKGLVFKDFGSLSRKLLCGLSGGESPAGGKRTILGELYNTNYNLNELIYGEEYCFKDSIAAENGTLDSDVTYDALTEMRLPPQVRRGVWQALKMTDECVSVVGKVPDKIFIEVTRSDGTAGKRTKSRQKKLADLYGEAQKTERDIKELVDELNRKTDMQLRKERLYLYFLQLGRCAYSGQKIDLEALNSDLYDVDHIMPRSITKDDSIDNKVLVRRELNVKKSNDYPLSTVLPEIVENMKSFWKMLNGICDNGEKLMSDKKYALLTRTKPLGEDDFREFVNCQIVVTGQTAKAVAELLKRKYGENTKIVYSKASNVNDFKQQFGIIKCRETNDLHHARDAYLNIVVGNVYHTRFSSVYDMFYYKDDAWREYNLQKLFTRSVRGAWNGEESVAHVKEVVNKHSMTVTRYAFTGKGKFYDETVYDKASGVAVPRKQTGPYSDPKKYGGYKGLSTGYFTVVHSLDKKGRLLKTIEAIPILIDAQEKTRPGSVMRYLTESRGLIEPKIVIDKLKVKSLLKYNGSYVWLAGKDTDTSFSYHNAMQWYTDEPTDKYVKALVKLRDMKNSGMISEREFANCEFQIHTNRRGDNEVVINCDNNVALYDMITEQLEKPFYGGLAGFASVRQLLVEKKGEFVKLSVIDQASVLLNAIHVLQCNGTNADLSLLGGSASAGRLRISNNITKADVTVINLSECGFTEKRRKL